ncbi:EAL domain-containing protein [Shewanella olleyana]|uniref:bifunctional diguanylate cyclase/phosphodiesterase n=1 Tax=Shewanella olleyana TaxID=135626 RepID=UPI00200C17AE|nr:EAL domain-containing protein [Shewanella olleyana]MCL1065536.1 EAL domain-containing protein [Shewanella olleyana]
MDSAQYISKSTENFDVLTHRSSSIERYSTILSMVLSGSPLREILHSLVLSIEAQKIGTKASVLLISNDKKRLLNGAAPSLPEEYNQAIHGVEIGPEVGSCGAAAATGKRIIVEDIETHPNWAAYKELPLKAGLKACWSEPIIDSHGEVLGTFAMYYDTKKSPSDLDLELIQEAAKLGSLAIERSQALHLQRLTSRIFSKLPMGLVITTDTHSLLQVNPMFKTITRDFTADKSVFEPEVFFEKSDEKSLVSMLKNLTRGKTWQGELIGYKRNGQTFDAEVTVTTFRDYHGEQNCFSWLITDISEHKSANKLIHYQANNDALTSLANRRCFLDKIYDYVWQHERTKQQNIACSVLLMDIDNFKLINDSLGNENGDGLLKEVADRLTLIAPRNSLLARMAGDEFGLFIPGQITVQELISIAKQINLSVAELVVIEGLHIHPTMSIGISRYPEDSTIVESLINFASQAMYDVKLKGRNSYQFFNKAMQKNAERTAYLQMELSKAINDEAFELYFQPIVSIHSSKIEKAEVLLRWQLNGEFISPEEFIPIAEQSGLIIPIGKWIRQQALAIITERWQQGHPIALAVNVSTCEFLTDDLQKQFICFFEDFIRDQAMSDFPFDLLTLEITESLMMEQHQNVETLLNQLRHWGIKISVDDFGTGYSSLSYLVNFPVDQIKIDKAFIQKIEQGPRHKALVEAIASMSNALELSVTAEGVETQAQLDFVKNNHVDAIQGYFFYRPMPKQAFYDLLASQ